MGPAIELAKKELNHCCDGPITAFVLIGRATELAKTVHSEVVANALYELLNEYGFMKEE